LLVLLILANSWTDTDRTIVQTAKHSQVDQLFPEQTAKHSQVDQLFTEQTAKHSRSDSYPFDSQTDMPTSANFWEKSLSEINIYNSYPLEKHIYIYIIFSKAFLKGHTCVHNG
jgi:hypothetical protein